MNQIINLPGIKSVKAEAVSYGMRTTYYITRVNFKDGRTITLQGELPKKEAFYQAYFQRALDAGLTNDEAHDFARIKYPLPIKKVAKGLLERQTHDFD